MEKQISTNVKLYSLIGIAIVIIGIFTSVYLKDYINYYFELYDYRQRLVERLTSDDVKKPVYKTGDPIKGNTNARIVIFEYGDFSCEGCRALQSVLDEVEDFYGLNNVLFIWKDLPVTIAPNNLRAHQAAHCANDQKSFFSYKDLLYENQGNFNDELFIALASQLNLDIETFETCLKDEKHKATVANNFSDALRIGLDSTPTLFINNQEVHSGFNFNNLRNIIESTR